MRQTLTFYSDDQAPLVRQRVACYLENAGYRAGDTQRAPVFHRGSFVRGLFTFSPRNWKSVVTVRVATAGAGRTAATIDYNINSTGQTITTGEAAFWDAEMQGLQRVVEDRTFDPTQHADAERAAVSGNWRYLGCILLGILVALPFGFALILAMTAIVRSAGIPLARWLVRQARVIGADTMSALLVLVITGLFAVYLLFAPPGGWSGWLAGRLPRSIPKPAVAIASLTLHVLSIALFVSLFAVLMAVLQNVKSEHELLWLVAVLPGIFMVALIDDRRKKK